MREPVAHPLSESPPNPTDRLLAHLAFVEELVRPMPDRASARTRLGAQLGWLLVNRLLRPGDEHILEELAGATAGAAVDVAPVALLELEPGLLEDRGVEVAAVIDHDHDG